MPTRDEVLAEFTRGRVTKWHSTHDMADEIVRLRELVATVDAEREQAYKVAQQNEQTARRLGRILDALREPSEVVMIAVQDAVYDQVLAPCHYREATVIVRAAVAAAEQEAQP